MDSDRAAIEARIPHRAPFLFVDRVIARASAPDGSPSSVVAEWDVPADGAWFAGHYPGRPILPGVLISEFAFQSAALLLADASAPADDGAVPVLTGIEQARFRRIVLPGETLRAEVRLLERLGSKHYLHATVTAGGETVLRIRFAVALKGAAARAEA